MSASSELVNQKQVADRAEVSIATVSKALRGQPGISPAMREKVRKAAAELGYRLPRARRNGNQQKSGQGASVRGKFIGVLIRRPLGGSVESASSYLEGMSRVSGPLNVSLVVQQLTATQDPLIILDERNQPPAMRDGVLAGLVLAGEWPAEVINSLARDHQVVVYPHYVVGADVDVVGVDCATNMLRIVSHLKNLGHERIGFVGRCGEMAWANERYGGYVRAIDRLGLPYEAEWVIDVPKAPMLEESHEAFWRKQLDHIESVKRDAGVDSWVCSSDWPAYQVYRGMTDRGYRIPQDLSITGFDGAEVVTLGCPPVTSVRIPCEAIGEAAFKRLVHRVNSPDSLVRQSLFAGDVVDNGTTAPPTYAVAKDAGYTRAVAESSARFG